MRCLRLLCSGLLLLITAPALLADELLLVSSPVSPPVSYALERQGKNFRFIVEAEGFQEAGKDVNVEVGVSGVKTVRLATKDAKVTRTGKTSRFVFQIPSQSVAAQAEGWKALRVAFAVEWAGASGQPARLKQSFLQSKTRAFHAGLSSDIADWLPLDMEEWTRAAEDRKLQIAVDYEQPMDGKATLVIEDSTGKRVRNLIAALPMAQGRQRVVWDGLDEQGNVVAPGDYRWRAISHPGLHPRHIMDFVDGPGSNHGTLHSAVAHGDKLYFAAPVAEGGHEFIELDADGKFLRGFNPPHGHGLRDVALAADEEYLYAVHDGIAWGDHVDKARPDWKAVNTVSIVRIHRSKWSIAEYPNSIRYVPLMKYETGPGSEGQRPDESQALAGLAMYQGRLYVGDSVGNRILVVDPATATVERSIPLNKPVALAAGKHQLFAIADGKLKQLNATTGKTDDLAALTGKPASLALTPDGRFAVGDHQDHVVQILDAKGTRVSTLGKPGGIAPGPYDPLKFHQPTGLAMLNGKLWVTEKERWQPKRFSAYDLESGKPLIEQFGPTNYGAQGAGFDPEDASKWIGQGTLFEVDFAKQTAVPKAILGGEEGRRHTFHRQDGRTFVITSGKATYIQELKDGVLKPLALLSSAHQFAYAHKWYPPQAFLDAFTKAYPNVKVVVGVRGGIKRVQPNHGYGMLWVDRNGDAEMQEEEIEFSTAAESLAGAGWSHDFHDLIIRVPATLEGKKLLVALKPEGWWPGGTPKYPALNDAVRAAVPIDVVGSVQVDSAVDRFGNIILNTDPDMTAFSPDGKRLWSYRNLWSNVHGSHKAPLPSIGQLQGVLFFSGLAELDDQADIMFMNGNHGQGFLMTSDGLYVDAIFPDVRMMTNPQAGGIGVLGGECFGGTFGKSQKDGQYYFQGGGISYRVYRVEGLDKTRRSQGSLKVTPAQVASAERLQARTLAEAATPKEAKLAWLESAPVIDGKDDDWKSREPVVKWDRDGKFPVTVHAGYDASSLYLHYTVRDESPWVNKGKDWQALFKTGDGIDLQLGTDTSANPRRSGPVPGDLRLFIAPSAEGETAVIYRHRVKGTGDKESVVFQSPWRSEKVDVVRKLTGAKIAVARGSGEYRVEASIPLSELGLDKGVPAVSQGDFGVIYGDGEGTVNIFRNYWSNQATGLVNDVPGEIMLNPSLWGQVEFSSSAGKQ